MMEPLRCIVVWRKPSDRPVGAAPGQDTLHTYGIEVGGFLAGWSPSSCPDSRTSTGVEGSPPDEDLQSTPSPSGPRRSNSAGGESAPSDSRLLGLRDLHDDEYLFTEEAVIDGRTPPLEEGDIASPG